MTELYKYEAVLRDLYWDQEMSMEAIGEKLDCGTNTIKRWLHKLDIPTRTKAGRTNKKEWHDKQRLESLYESGLSIRDIAERFGVHKTTIEHWMDKHDIEMRGKTEMKKKRPCSHYVDNDGYEIVASRNKSTSVHRLIMVAEYGLENVIGKEVHHQNSIPWDNRPENLEVVSASEHSKLHSKDSEFWKSSKKWQKGQD